MNVQPSDSASNEDVNLFGRLYAISYFVIVGILYFLGTDSFFSAAIDDLLPKLVFVTFLACAALCFFFLYSRFLKRRARSAYGSTTSQTCAHTSVSVIAFISFSLGAAITAIVWAGMLSLVRLTASTPTQFYAQIRVTKGSGHGSCVYDLIFYNLSVGRDVKLCAENRDLVGAHSGDVLLVRANVGPFGAQLVGLRQMRR